MQAPWSRESGLTNVRLRLNDLRVGDVMSSPVKTIEGEGKKAAHAFDIMASGHVQHLVVVDRQGRAIGVISDRDLRGAQPSLLLVPDPEMRRKALNVISIEQVMTPKMHALGPETRLRTAIDRMLNRNVGCLPIVDADEKPVGILTGRDLTKLLVRAMDAEQE